MDAFHPPIARVYCWVAADHALPPLAFYAKDAMVLPWTCKQDQFGTPVPFEAFRAE
jgi:hypothetical protein